MAIMFTLGCSVFIFLEKLVDFVYCETDYQNTICILMQYTTYTTDRMFLQNKMCSATNILIRTPPMRK